MSDNNKPKINVPRFNLTWLYVIIALIFAFLYFSGDEGSATKEVNYTEFQEMVTKGYADKIVAYDNNTVEMYIKPDHIVDVFKKDANKVGRSPSINVQIGSMEALDKFLDEQTKEGNFTGSIQYEKKSDYFSIILWNVLPFVFLIGIWMFAMRRMGGGGGAGGGSNVFNVGRSKAQLFEKGTNRITFKDVAGQAAAKQEVQEIVDFLKQPQKYTELGGKIPKGALLVGPPGTGKTLLAKAVAGEADVPFFSISGSDFVEMFVGVGASRVRDLFDTAKKNSPAIIFIDEIDAVGRQRGAGMGGGHDEREQTLNQLLVEMDGFSGNEGVIVIAATNRSDVLDPALLRPGRFDRQILVGRPDVKGREAILRVHAKNKPLADDVDLKVIAQQTPGFAGADLENVLNEAALVAARRNKTKIDASDIDEAEDRVIAGPAKKDRVISKREREMVAYHEAGHTIVGLVLSRARVVHKVTIIPRGRAGGYMIALPKEDQMLLTKDDMFEQIVGLLGGRTAEEIIFGVQSTGASNDFEQATALARSMVTEYGMSEKLGPVQYEGNHQVFIGRDYGQTKAYSEQIAYEIDQEVRRILMEAHDKAREIIETHRDKHKLIAEKLLEFETLDAKAIKSLFETGEMPAQDESEFPSEKAQSYEEAKRALEERDAKKQAQSDEDTTITPDDTTEE